MTLLQVPVCALAVSLGVACGPEPTDPIGVEAETIELGSPVALQQLQVTPDCYQAYATPLPLVSVGEAYLLDYALQQRELLAMQAEFDLQFVQLLLEPVLADPTALQWDVQLGSRVVEGVTLARGEDWGSLLLTMTFSPPPEWEDRTQFTMQIDYNRDRTELDMDFFKGDVIAAADYFRYGTFARGCSARSKVSYEYGPWTVGDGLENRILCWPHDDFEWQETGEQFGSDQHQQLRSACYELVQKHLSDSLADEVEGSSIIFAFVP